MVSYREEYARLNAQQKRAVDIIDGPLLVVAGPGTGKTQLLGMRVANIMLSSDVYPDNILCLTFTNKAADNMKDRLIQIIGPDAYKVQIKTFHGLAADIMNRYPQYFWRGARLSIAPDAIQLEVMRHVLGKLPPEHPLTLKFAGQFTLVNDVSAAIKLAKEAGLTPDKLRAIITSNLAYIKRVEPHIMELSSLTVSKKNLPAIAKIVEHLPVQAIDTLITPLTSLQTIIQTSFEHAVREAEESDKTTPISKWKARWLQKQDGAYGMFNERARNEWWLAIADAYEHYRGQLHLRGYYDYADMLVEVIGQLEQQGDLRATLQEQFQYVLIDEFQDTNAAQLRLAHLIADHPDIPHPNIMAVGDDDQSIFKFQGAELSNMLGFTRQYPEAEPIVLTDNYRSTQDVLTSTDSIIGHARYRLVTEQPGLSKRLVAKHAPTQAGLIENRVFRSRQEHLSGLATAAAEQLKLGRSVAVLARHHASLRDMAGLLHKRGSAISYEQSNDILELPAIEQLYLILKIIVHSKRGELQMVNELLSLTLRHPMWQISSEMLWRFAISQQTRHDWLQGTHDAKDAELNHIGSWLTWLSELSAQEPLAVVIEHILGLRDNDILDSPIKTYFFDGNGINESYLETLSAVHILRGLVSEFRGVGVSKVEDFVQFADLMRASGKIISDTSPFVSGERCIELLSVHKAKGLEFDSVIIVDAVEPEWSPHNRGRLPPANLPLRPAEDDSDDYVRLMYVAATRAKHTLIFGSYELDSKSEAVRPAHSLSSIPTAKQPVQSDAELIDVLEETMAWPKLELSDETRLLKPLLENFQLNVTNLINFLDITAGGPRHFKERNLLRLPGAKSPAAAMGTAVHAALQEAQLQSRQGGLDMRSLFVRFETVLLGEGLPEADYRTRVADGRRILKRFIETYRWKFLPDAVPEYKISDVSVGQARLGGTLDVLSNSGQETIVQDYKTGRPLGSLAALSGNEGLKAWRHKLQLIFYALLVQRELTIPANATVKGQMVYVEADKSSKLTLEYLPTKDDVTRLGTLVQVVWKHIMALDFPDVSSYTPDVKGIKKFEEDLLNGRI